MTIIESLQLQNKQIHCLKIDEFIKYPPSIYESDPIPE